MTQLLYSHVRDTVNAYRKKDTIKVLLFFSIPRYLKQWQDAANFFLTVSLVVMLCLEPILWCWGHTNKTFDADCRQVRNLTFPYSIFSMFAMFLYYVLLIDLTVISTRISAFTLVCVRMLSEVALFLGALFVAILTFSCAISVLKQENPDFAGIHKGAYALLRVVIAAYDAKRYAALRDEPVLLVMTIVFAIVT